MMSEVTVSRRFARQARLMPDAMALIGREVSLSYRDLNRCANHLAWRLVHCGVMPGARVGLCIPRSVGAVIAMLAVMKSGGVFVPVDPSWPAQTRRSYLSECDAHHVLVDDQGEEFDHGDGIQNIRVGHAAMAACGDAEDIDLTSHTDAPVYIMFTSGSTGRPKGVVIPHRGVIRLVCEPDYIRMDRDDTVLSLAPITFDASTFEIWGALLNGARLVVYEPKNFDPHVLGRLLESERVSILWLTAGLFHLVARYQLPLLRGLRVLLAGGDVLQAEMVNKVLDAWPHLTLINGYGPTENTTFTCCHSMTHNDRPHSSVPIGRPIAGTEIRILDADLRDVPDGIEGELFAGGLGVALGYLNAPDASRAAFVGIPGSSALFYRTGDLVKRRADGTIEFVGRRDHQVKIRGFRVSVEEVQAAVLNIEEVEECLVRIRIDSMGGKSLEALIQTGSKRIDIEKFVRQKLFKSIPEFMIPDSIKKVSSLPLNANGKIDRNPID